MQITRNRVLALKSSSADAEFRFEIEGPIMPLCLTRIIDLFNVTQRGTFGVSLSPFNNSKGVNVHPMPSESVSTQMVPNPKALLPKFQSEELDELAHSCGVTRRELDTLTKPPSAQLTSVRRIQKESSSSPYVWWAS
ncbi:hypothetical protein SARC_08787 [Sphaeroforma arctica JP610]|uniref:Uncharacterized protein n=1 Tax=Sphaeroforma arctica JP610 TaxID=667725 RepID=A0A0L0FS45_9EUKA|nr:hypothetical protein SARC_08787 [Sphaeroforma arctica JP610]KNC78798.1 hypothetical protein SARC_08787 [Sphaeroforma arctica JP610]|eukprot:XP_014152700.1 hypothetical protein SARC_08787 [Sphaeroforma arctica JP610]